MVAQKLEKNISALRNIIFKEDICTRSENEINLISLSLLLFECVSGILGLEFCHTEDRFLFFYHKGYRRSIHCHKGKSRRQL